MAEPQNTQAELLEAVGELTKAVRAIAHGDVHAPGGLEGLAVAVAGTGLSDSLAEAVREGMSELASALSEGLAQVAAAVEKSAPPSGE